MTEGPHMAGKSKNNMGTSSLVGGIGDPNQGHSGISPGKSLRRLPFLAVTSAVFEGMRMKMELNMWLPKQYSKKHSSKFKGVEQ